MASSRRSRENTRGSGVAAAVMVVVLMALPACAAEPKAEAKPSATPTTTTSPTPDPYTGPLTFAGDDLVAFALSPDEVAGLLPGAAPAGAVTDELLQYSDGGGPDFDPSVCVLLLSEMSMRSVAARTVPWKDPEDSSNSGRQQILQFASEEQASTRMDQLTSTIDHCAQFDAQGPGTFETAVAPELEGVRAFAGTLTLDSSGSRWRVHHGFASVGNVLVELWQPALDGSEFDAERAALLLRDRAVEAKAALITDLTDNPPATETPTPTDPAAPWSEWQLSGAGVGPLIFGADRESALAAVPGATVEEVEWTDSFARLWSGDGDESLVLHFTDDGATLIGVTAGIANMEGDVEPDGAALPAAGAVRIGASLSDAAAAFPGARSSASSRPASTSTSGRRGTAE
ncbi:sensor domain-containing protein [Microbacterium sp. Se5.02b]|uniref:sensor domain-containing protein n=1 Tax=Microbacterium sp. Se5.02b TaxID=2864103 RepID=UPI001C6934A2|nr:sensor domain-containing protein [Microbacterium sp. Se5.02b]QYM65363.1 sensor domain-containing protein [Microbacterium sp. Se5.02b]